MLINVPASCIVLKQVFCYSAVNVQKLYGFILMSTRLRYKLLLIIKKKGNGRNYQQYVLNSSDLIGGLTNI